MGLQYVSWVRCLVWLTYRVEVCAVHLTLIVWTYHRTNSTIVN